MSNEMPSWRSLANSASKSIKGYVAQQRDLRLRAPPASREGPGADGSSRSTWSQWAGQKIRSMGQGENSSISTETLSLFPGWACRKYISSRHPTLQDPVPFNIEIFISGFASRSSGQGFGSRAGKAFLRLAKSYASLPKLVIQGPDEASTSLPQGMSANASADDLLVSMHLPPKPDDMTDEAELEALNAQLQQMDRDNASVTTTESSASSRRSGSPTGLSSASLYPPSTSSSSTSDTYLQRMHNNLETRLHPFWSSSLGSRSIRIAIYVTHPSEHQSYKSPPLCEDPYDDEAALQCQPIATQEIATAADGSFQARLTLSWDKMCVHPGALHIAFGDPDIEHELFITADLLPGPSRPVSPGSAQVPYAVRTPRVHRQVFPTDSKTLTIPLTHSPVRLISDIDDTVKMSGILSGTRAVFHNVFVKDLNDSIIPGMGDWYMDMWRRGVRFHYVSNSPFELLPVINEFIHLSRLPPGSVKLKSYAGRSLFNGLLSAPAERKRAGIVDLLDNFADGRFFLVGDSGEQDLELYASLARERPPQILGIFIRDASNHALVRPLDDPTGQRPPQSPPSLSNGRRETQSAPTLKPDAFAPNSRRPTTCSMPDTLPGRRPPPLPRRKSSNATPSTSPAPILGDADYFPSQLLIDAPISEEPSSLSPTQFNAPMTYPPPGFARNGNGNWGPGMQGQDGYFSSSRSSSGRSSSTVSPGGSGRPVPMSDAERKQFELQLRVYRARLEIPDHIPLRVFREPSECVEARMVLDKLKMGRRQL